MSECPTLSPFTESGGRSRHRLRHRPAHDGDPANRNRSGLRRFEADDSVIPGRKPDETPARAEKTIIGISHAVLPEGCFQTTFIERTVMGYQRQTRQLRRDVGPNLRKGSRVRRIPIRQTVYAGIPGAVIVGIRPDQAIDLLPDVPVLHPDQPHAANTGAFSVGRFKIDRDEILHKTVKISSQVRCATSAKVRKQSGTVKRGHPFRKRHAAPYRIELHSAWEKSGFMTILQHIRATRRSVKNPHVPLMQYGTYG